MIITDLIKTNPNKKPWNNREIQTKNREIQANTKIAAGSSPPPSPTKKKDALHNLSSSNANIPRIYPPHPEKIPTKGQHRQRERVRAGHQWKPTRGQSLVEAARSCTLQRCSDHWCCWFCLTREQSLPAPTWDSLGCHGRYVSARVCGCSATACSRPPRAALLLLFVVTDESAGRPREENAQKIFRKITIITIQIR